MASTKSMCRLAMFALAMAMAAVVAMAQNTIQDFVNLHNRARAADGVGSVVWDATVAKFTRAYAVERYADCKLQHSKSPPRVYGENIFWGGAGKSWSATDAVNMWVDEKRYYHRSSNTCDAGKVCGHYTQVVWRKSTRIGCARVICAANRGIFIVCNYNLPGNYPGQRPF